MRATTGNVVSESTRDMLVWDRNPTCRDQEAEENGKKKKKKKFHFVCPLVSLHVRIPRNEGFLLSSSLLPPLTPRSHMDNSALIISGFSSHPPLI